MTPEFSHRLAVERIGPAGQTITIEATVAERAALAARLQLAMISALTCRFHLRPAAAGTVTAEGWLDAVVTQTCVVSLDEFEAPVGDHFVIYFVPAGDEGDDIDPESIDEIPYDDGMIDLGEAAAEQLALALDPWPRKPDATLPDTTTEAATSPFAALTHKQLPS
jgi:uncharacterized metal-binding protein YceD (DUF177 family)